MSTPPRNPSPTPADDHSPAIADTPPTIQRGTAHVLLAYEIGLAIDLERAERHISSNRQRGSLRHKRRAPYYFEYQPAPLRVTYTLDPVSVAGFATAASVDVVIYDFGAASVQFSIPLHGGFARLLDLSESLWDHAELARLGRRIVNEVVRSIEPAITKPAVSDFAEDYVIYQIEQLHPTQAPEQVIVDHAALLSQILRAERERLSHEEIRDALSCQIAFGEHDRTLIDWNATLLFDRDADDVRAVLEFANVELLELRYLDDCLDVALDEAYETSSRQPNRLRIFLGNATRDLWHIAQLQMDSAVLYESVNNALKLLGDQYLARVHRLASQRFHLNAWNASILRKLETLEGNYQRIADFSANRRIEVLEWIIIILIAIEIIMAFIPGLH